MSAQSARITKLQYANVQGTVRAPSNSHSLIYFTALMPYVKPDDNTMRAKYSDEIILTLKLRWESSPVCQRGETWVLSSLIPEGAAERKKLPLEHLALMVLSSGFTYGISAVK